MEKIHFQQTGDKKKLWLLGSTFLRSRPERNGNLWQKKKCTKIKKEKKDKKKNIVCSTQFKSEKYLSSMCL